MSNLQNNDISELHKTIDNILSDISTGTLKENTSTLIPQLKAAYISLLRNYNFKLANKSTISESELVKLFNCKVSLKRLFERIKDLEEGPSHNSSSMFVKPSTSTSLAPKESSFSTSIRQSEKRGPTTTEYLEDITTSEIDDIKPNRSLSAQQGTNLPNFQNLQNLVPQGTNMPNLQNLVPQGFSPVKAGNEFYDMLVSKTSEIFNALAPQKGGHGELDADKPTLIYAWSETCPFSLNFNKEWKKFLDIAARNSNLQIVEINTTKKPKFESYVQSLGAKYYPSLIYIKDGRKQIIEAGDMTAKEVLDLIQ